MLLYMAVYSLSSCSCLKVPNVARRQTRPKKKNVGLIHQVPTVSHLKRRITSPFLGEYPISCSSAFLFVHFVLHSANETWRKGPSCIKWNWCSSEVRACALLMPKKKIPSNFPRVRILSAHNSNKVLLGNYLTTMSWGNSRCRPRLHAWNVRICVCLCTTFKQ